MVLVLVGGMWFAGEWSDRVWMLGWFLLGLVAIKLLLLAHQNWVLLPLLMKVEKLWAQGIPISVVLEASKPLSSANGVIGYRGMMLRSWAYFANGQRNHAAFEARSAHAVKRPWWLRWPVNVCYLLKRFNWSWPSSAIAFLIPLDTEICWHKAEKAFDSKNAEIDSMGWRLLLECLSVASDDAQFLDTCMAKALERLEYNQSGSKPPISGPEARAVLERSMNLLTHRHSDPRLPWSRTRLAQYLSKERRYGSVLALCGALPPAFRPVELWVVEARTWGQLGDLSCAWATVDSAIKVHPASYRLWMETFKIAMARGDGSTANRSLEHASRYISSQCAITERWEFHLARSEYFYWVEGNTDAAWKQLAKVPDSILEDYRPDLKARILLSKRLFEEAYKKISELLETHPNNTDFVLMQSEAMAGMGAWEALLPHLDSMGDEAREKAVYWHIKGLANKKMANEVQGREDLERAAWMDPFNIPYVISAGMACLELGESIRSEQHWRRVLKIDPRNREALLRLAETREIQYDIATAKSLLRECLNYYPDFARANEMLMRLEAN